MNKLSILRSVNVVPDNVRQKTDRPVPIEVNAMQYLIILITAISVLFWNTGYCEDNIYTWKDKNGVLNITDAPPPAGAELIETSPGHREEALEILRQQQILQEKRAHFQREIELEQQAAREKKQNLEAQEEAAALMEEAEEMREGVSGGLRKRSRYERRAQRLEEQAQEILENPDLAGEKKMGNTQDEKPRKSSGY